MSVIEQTKNDLVAGMQGRAFSGQTKMVRINLVAMTRQEYSEEIEVPVDFNDDDLSNLTDAAYDAADGSEFTDDSEYWEKGDCSHEEL